MDMKNKYQAIVVESGNTLSHLFNGLFEQLDFEPVSFSSTSAAMDYFGRPAMDDLGPYSSRLVVLEWSAASAEQFCQFIKGIRSNRDGLYVTIVMVSGEVSFAALKAVVEAGLDSFYTNTFEENEAFALWLSTVEKGVRDACEREEKDSKIAYYKTEQEDFNNQLEEAISRANQMTREAEQSFIEINQIFKTIYGGIIVIDTDCNLLRCNDTFLEMINKTREEALEAKCYESFHSVLCDSEQCPLQVIKKGKKRVEHDIEFTLADGRTVFYHIISTPFRGAVGELIGVVEHITDITARVEAENALQESERRYKELSTIDELTQLYNKRYFNAHFKMEIERAQRYGQPLSLLLMDIDNFKHHNDTYGHADGDKVLAELGKVIKASIRVTDIGCRYGGEEFTVILPQTSGESAVIVAERIRQGFAELEFKPNPNEVVQKSISVGISQFGLGDTVQTLLERTDQNMYKAKDSGKNRCVYE
jgi:two-component system cell cycle response regulator